MNRRTHLRLLALIVAFGCTAEAAELHLRREARSTGSLVTLGDVADIYAESEVEKSQLASIELFPAPAGNQTRLVRAREIQDLLAQRDVDLRKNRLAGASAVKISAARIVTASAESPAPAGKEFFEERVAEYLRQHADDTAWNVDINMTSDLSRISQQDIIVIKGGRAPWVGSQHFTVVGRTADGTQEVAVIAQVERPLAVLVPVRPLARGEVIQASDVQLQAVSVAAVNPHAFSNLEAVVGQEATRPLPAGRPLQESDVQPSVLVKKNSIVTVFARSPGVQVRTSAKALEDGARDDVIKLQSLNDRNEEFVARVIAFKEVEILAGAPRIETHHIETSGAQPPKTERPSRPFGRLGTTQHPSLFGLRVQGAATPAHSD